MTLVTNSLVANSGIKSQDNSPQNSITSSLKFWERRKDRTEVTICDSVCYLLNILRAMIVDEPGSAGLWSLPAEGIKLCQVLEFHALGSTVPDPTFE